MRETNARPGEITELEPGEIAAYIPTLTKREHFAIEAMRGLLVRGTHTDDAARYAVKLADDLLRELNGNRGRY